MTKCDERYGVAGIIEVEELVMHVQGAVRRSEGQGCFKGVGSYRDSEAELEITVLLSALT